MGKRELVLILAFIAVGALVFQFTAPPPQAGQQGFRVGRVVDAIRQGVRGRPEHAVIKSTRTEAIDASVTELRIDIPIVDLTVTGEDRPDVSFDLTADSNGADEAEAKRLAGEVVLKIDRAGSGLVTTMRFPEDGTQHATLVIHVPTRLAVRLESESRIGKLAISGVAAVNARSNRGESTIKDIAGEVVLRHRGGALQLAGAGSARLNVSGADGRIEQVRGPASIEVSGSRLDLSSLAGPLEITSRGTDIKLHDSAGLKAPLRLDLQSGRVEVRDLAVEARIDGHDTELIIDVARIAPLTIYDTSEDIALALPRAGYSLDAIATDGKISSDDQTLKPAGDDREQRMSGSVRGGGPAIVLRNSRGDIRITTRGGT